MADSRRRTLANTQSGSGIPIPSSAARPNARQSLAASHSRQSLAPARLGASRGSIAPSTSQPDLGAGGGSQGSQMFSQGHGGPTTVQREAPTTVGRSSLYTSAGAMSASRSQAVLRSGGAQMEYAPPSERRTSSYRRSLGGGAATTPIGAYTTHLISRPAKDLRDVRSSAARQRNANHILEFLKNLGFHAEMKMLLTPTAKDFQNIFKFLISELDPGFRFGGMGKKFEEEVIPALKTIMYPFPDSITKSHLQSIGSQQSWPNMLAMLHWIVVLIQSREEAFQNAPDIHMPARIEDADASPDYAYHAWLDYVGETYPQFLADDHFDPAQSSELENYYQRIEPPRRLLHTKVDELRESFAARKKTLEALRSEPDALALVARETEKLANDAESVDKYTTSLANKIAGGRSQILIFNEKEAELLSKTSGADSERAQLNAQVEQQGISPVEIQNMNSERTNLQTALAQANHKQETILKKSYDLEIDLQRGLENTAQLCATYELKATAIGILPVAPEGFESVNFAQELNGAADNPVPDCQTLLRPALVQLKNRARAEGVRLAEEDAVLEEGLTRTKEAIGELKETVEADEIEMSQLEQDVEDAKESASNELAGLVAEESRLSSSVSQINSTMRLSLITAQAHYDQRSIEKESAEDVAIRVLREQQQAYEVMLESTLGYKSYLMEKANELYALIEEDA